MVYMGSLYPPNEDPKMSLLPSYRREGLKSTLRVSLDDKEVFKAHTQFHDADPRTVDVGSNIIGISSCSAIFTGNIQEVHHELKDLSSNSHPEYTAGPVAMDILFPSNRIGRSEPMVVTGSKGRADIFFVSYLDDHTVRFGLDHWGAGLVMSDPVSIDYTKTHKFKISLGSFYPESEIDKASSYYAAKVEKLRKSIDAEMDDRSILNQPAAFYPASDKAIELGHNQIEASSCDIAFNGTIENVEHLGFGFDAVRRVQSRDYGPITLNLAFPGDRVGSREPLVSTGKTGAGDLLYVTYVDRNHVTLTLDHWGIGGPTSLPIEVKYGDLYDLKIDMGSLYPDQSTGTKETLSGEGLAKRRHTLEVQLN